MKILQINNYHYVRGGADRVYFETAKLLEKHGHEILLRVGLKSGFTGLINFLMLNYYLLKRSYQLWRRCPKK